MEEYFCNSCLEQFKPGDEGAGLRCAHLLCRKCSEKQLASEPLACPICRTGLAPSDIHIVGMNTAQEDASTLWSLVGKSSQTAMDVAHFSFQFAIQQAEMYAAAREQQHSEEKIARMNEACKTRMTDLYQGYKKAKRKVQELVQHGQEVEAQLKAENDELRAKYNHKDSEAQSLRQKLPVLQQENDDLRQTCMQLARQAGVNPAQIPLLKTGGAGNSGGGHFGGNSNNNMQARRSSFPALPSSSPQAAGGFGVGSGGGSGARGFLPAPPPRRPAPSPFISPSSSHGNGIDTFTPVTAPVQRQALLNSGPRPQLGAPFLCTNGAGGGGSVGVGSAGPMRVRPGSGGGGVGGGMPPPDTRRGSLVPMGISPSRQQQQLGFGNGFHHGGSSGGGGRGSGSGYY